MSRPKKTLLLIAWLVVGTHIFAYLWSQNLDAFQLPEAIGLWLSQIMGPSDNAEQITLIYLFGISFVAVLLATLIAYGVARLFRGPRV